MYKNDWSIMSFVVQGNELTPWWGPPTGASSSIPHLHFSYSLTSATVSSFVFFLLCPVRLCQTYGFCSELDLIYSGLGLYLYLDFRIELENFSHLLFLSPLLYLDHFNLNCLQPCVTELEN